MFHFREGKRVTVGMSFSVTRVARAGLAASVALAAGFHLRNEDSPFRSGFFLISCIFFLFLKLHLNEFTAMLLIPRFFGPPGSGSGSSRTRYGSASFYNQSIIVRTKSV
jgi:hypothetical protein